MHVLRAFSFLAALSTSFCRAADETCSASSNTCTVSQNADYFGTIPYIQYEGPESKNPYAFRYYNKDEIILGKPMKEWLRFSVAFWHSFRGDGSDPFGVGTRRFPWDDGSETLSNAYERMRANFELLKKLGVDFWCFHDRDIAPEGKTLQESNENLDKVVDLALSLQDGTGITPLWGTAQLFKHPKYLSGAATSPTIHAYVDAAAQVKKAMEVTQKLNGKNFVFWGGREGYQTLLNTDMERELNHSAIFFRLAAEHKKAIGFEGTLLIEPKPQEPTKHQYDWDTATTMAFLMKYGLEKDYKINVECNHATLSGHSCHHEVETARIFGVLGNVDANTGDPQIGWDTDQFMTDVREATLIMHTVIKNGGIAPGGFNFDAKLRRESTSYEDLMIAHIVGMDTLAHGLRNAAKMHEEGLLDELVKERYKSWDSDLGTMINTGKKTLKQLSAIALLDPTERPVPSAKQERAEQILSYYA